MGNYRNKVFAIHWMVFFVLLFIYFLIPNLWIGVMAFMYLVIGGLVLWAIMNDYDEKHDPSYVNPFVPKQYTYQQTQTTNIKRDRHVTPSVRMDVLERDNYTCQICGKTRADGVKLEVDHIIPVSKGGSDNMSNLQTLCFDCNRGKSNKILYNHINE